MGIQRATQILRPLVVFMLPLPYLITFGRGHMSDWPGYLAFAACAVLTVSGFWFAWAAFRRQS